MKKLFLILAAVGVMGFSAVNVYAQEAETQAPEAEATEQVAAEVETEGASTPKPKSRVLRCTRPSSRNSSRAVQAG